MIESASEFLRLSLSDIKEEYYDLARWESAPDEVWIEVIHKHHEMRTLVALNKTISEKIIRLLFATGDSDVKSVLAQKRKTPPDILEALSKDVDESLRLMVSYNPKVPRPVLEALLDDEWENVRVSARERLLKNK